jgi:hypothetical protein
MSKEKWEMWCRVRKHLEVPNDQAAIDMLQEHGLISDEVVGLEDLSFADMVRADRILREGITA